MKTSKSGFTLMELLVVIVIISLLAGMLFPVFSRIQDRGREVKCTSNLRQLHTAAMSFMSNNGGYLPHAASAKRWDRDDADVWQETGWINGWVASYEVNTDDMISYWWDQGGTNGIYCIQRGSIFPYLGDAGDESVYVCPTMLLKAREDLNGDYENVTRSYGMNVKLSNAKYSDIDGVSRKMLFADQGFQVGARNLYGAATGSPGPSDDDPDDTTSGGTYFQRFNKAMDGCIDYQLGSDLENIGELHGRNPGQNTGMAKVVFADGHVESVEHVNSEYIQDGRWEYGQRVE
jgi:prepilin-type N-terminal cleavage/methylation domain-containing protein/prepilin-type processing-associated H-X9-DG protein